MLELKSRDFLGDPALKKHFNEALFAEVAPRYDFVTRALSFGRDQGWKRHLIAALPECPAPVCVDLACGTGDVCDRLAERYPGGSILGIDLSEAMLELARSRGGGSSGPIEFRRADMAETGLADASADIVTGSYALRNAPDLGPALAEVARILKPGAVCAFLDFSRDSRKLPAAIAHGLLKLWGGIWGLLLHANPDVYAYIANSLAGFPDREALTRKFDAAGLKIVDRRRFMAGMLELVVAEKV